MRPELSLVLPFRNQADHILPLLERYRTTLKGRPWEIILVPNACTDDTPKICRAFTKKHRNFRVVENPKGGWGLSVLMGMSAARGRFLAYTNSARTDPAQVPALFKKLPKGSHALAKVTRHQRGHFLREAGSFFYNLECGTLFDIPSGDVNGTPKILPAELWKRFRCQEPGDLLDAELLAHCAKARVPIIEMKVAGWGRHGGKSTTNWKSAARMYSGAVRLWRRLHAATA